MKKGIFIISLFFLLTQPAAAGEIPDCWDQPENFQDGVFLISFSANDVTKRELLEILNRVRGKHIEAREYPVVMDDFFVITVQAVDYGVGEYRLSREQLKQAVREELTPISRIDGVTIACNTLYRLPRPEPRPRPRRSESPDENHFRWDNGEDKGWRR